MSKPTKSQWDFGELFPATATRKVLSVSELTSQVRSLLEKHIGQVWVGGEVTNLRAQNSGHLYFTLKDGGAQLSCVLFSREKVSQRALLADGQKVLLQGDLTVYEPRGQYQMIVRAVELQGVGALQMAFERLKQKLAAEGLFAPERKRPLPRYPRRIGLVTSPTGAAIRDVLHVIQRRNPALEIILVPVPFLNRLFPSSRRWGMRLILPSPISWRICAPPPPVRRQKSSRKITWPAGILSGKPPYDSSALRAGA
jgi:exodeoxyribonuclease VII large subunit